MHGQSAGENGIGTCCVDAEQFEREGEEATAPQSALQTPARTVLPPTSTAAQPFLRD